VIDGQKNLQLKTVLHVTSTDVAGGRFNGLMLGPELAKYGIDSRQAVWQKDGKAETTRQIFANKFFFRLNKVTEIIERQLSLVSFLYIWAPLRLWLDQKNFKTDLYHFHLIHNGFFSLLFLPILTRLRPSVWTIHDPWAMTGRCVYSLGCDGWKTGCGRCPNLKTHFTTRRDHSAFMWRLKKLIYRLSKFEIIVASEFMKDMVAESPLLRDKRVHVVPFGLDTDLFVPTSQEQAQRAMGVIPGSFVIAFRANGGMLKGTEYILEALRRLKTDRPICLISFEVRGMLDEFRGRYQIIDLGWINAEKTFVEAYNAADIFLMPSIEEAFGMMAMESMACGTPVITFDGTSVPEVIHSPRAGLSVPHRDAEALKDAIEKCIRSPEALKQLGHNARTLARELYPVRKHVESIKYVYEEAFRRWHLGETSPSRQEAGSFAERF
jgi:glycosyltransferase involved in cell wall biosynthesis